MTVIRLATVVILGLVVASALAQDNLLVQDQQLMFTGSNIVNDTVHGIHGEGRKKCKQGKKCKKQGGKCVAKGECDGNVFPKGCKSGCECCLPISTADQCKQKDGFCVKSNDHCGGVIQIIHTSTDDQCCCCIEPHKDCNKDCDHWCYPSTKWPLTCPQYCDGVNQSPIDLFNNDLSGNSPGPLTFSDSYYDQIQYITIKNDGRTVGVDLDSSEPARTISDGGLNGSYTLAEFHFHWGCENDRGSEHTIMGFRYAMELHFVHYKTSYGNYSEALKYEDGLAKLGILFKVTSWTRSALEPITTRLPEVVMPGSEKKIYFGRNLMEFIPSESRRYYRYQGSLTTPSCNEVVIWSVFDTALYFSQEQVDMFRMLEDKEGNQMCDNYRDTQHLNGRMVTYVG